MAGASHKGRSGSTQSGGSRNGGGCGDPEKGSGSGGPAGGTQLVVIDPHTLIEGVKEQLAKKQGIPAEQQRLTFSAGSTSSGAHPNRGSFSPACLGINTGCRQEELVGECSNWRAILYKDGRAIGQLCSPRLIQGSASSPVDLGSEIQELLSEVGIQLKVFQLVYDHWQPSWASPKSPANPLYLPVDEAFVGSAYRIQVIGKLDGHSVALPHNFRVVGKEVLAALSLQQQKADYVRRHQQQRGAVTPLPAAGNRRAVSPAVQAADAIVLCGRGFEKIAAIYDITDEPSWLKCLVLPITVAVLASPPNIPRPQDQSRSVEGGGKDNAEGPIRPSSDKLGGVQKQGGGGVAAGPKSVAVPEAQPPNKRKKNKRKKRVQGKPAASEGTGAVTGGADPATGREQVPGGRGKPPASAMSIKSLKEAAKGEEVAGSPKEDAQNGKMEFDAEKSYDRARGEAELHSNEQQSASLASQSRGGRASQPPRSPARHAAAYSQSHEGAQQSQGMSTPGSPGRYVPPAQRHPESHTEEDTQEKASNGGGGSGQHHSRGGSRKQQHHHHHHQHHHHHKHGEGHHSGHRKFKTPKNSNVNSAEGHQGQQQQQAQAHNNPAAGKWRSIVTDAASGSPPRGNGAIDLTGMGLSQNWDSPMALPHGSSLSACTTPVSGMVLKGNREEMAAPQEVVTQAAERLQKQPAPWEHRRRWSADFDRASEGSGSQHAYEVPLDEPAGGAALAPPIGLGGSPLGRGILQSPSPESMATMGVAPYAQPAASIAGVPSNGPSIMWGMMAERMLESLQAAGYNGFTHPPPVEEPPLPPPGLHGPPVTDSTLPALPGGLPPSDSAPDMRSSHHGSVANSSFSSSHVVESTASSFTSENGSSADSSEQTEPSLAGKHPTTDIDRLLSRVTPIVTLEAARSGAQPTQLGLPTMEKVWDWYNEPSVYGQGVYTIGGTRGASMSYYVPFISAIRLFTAYCAKGSSNDKSGQVFTSDVEGWPPKMKLAFEYIEMAPPKDRLPLTEKIDLLARGVGLEDPSKWNSALVKHMKLQDVHPHSWYAVTWYPIYRIPDAPLKAAFLTFHTLAPVAMACAPHKCPPQRGDTGVPPQPDSYDLQVVGLEWYAMGNEAWFESQPEPAGGGDPLASQGAIQAYVSELRARAARLARSLGSRSGRTLHHDYNFFNFRNRNF